MINKPGAKVFIVYASAGAGHFKAAEAVYKYIKANAGNFDARLIDILDKTNPLFSFIYKWGYDFLIKYIPSLWMLLFLVTSNKFMLFFLKPLILPLNRLNAKKFIKQLIAEAPDFIVSTHFLPSEISAYLKRTSRIKSKVITVITDFGVHPFWLAEGTDLYISASDFTKDILCSYGVKEDIIKVTGIPIDEKFVKSFDRDILCKKFNLSPDSFKVLIMTGSFGIGPIEEIISYLKEYKLEIIVVCAKNKKLYSRLQSTRSDNVRAFGFVDNVEELMAVSKVIITKPGGLSISELLVMGLVPIFISAIPGQEAENIRVMRNFGIGLFINDAVCIKDAVLKYMNNHQEVLALKENVKKIAKPYASRGVFDALC